MNCSLVFHTGNLNKIKTQAHEKKLNNRPPEATLARAAHYCEIAADEQKITNYMTW